MFLNPERFLDFNIDKLVTGINIIYDPLKQDNVIGDIISDFINKHIIREESSIMINERHYDILNPTT